MLKKNRPNLIAEIGWNFLGNLDLAKKMIKAAKSSGADFVKFQIWNPKNLKTGAWDDDGRREIYLKAFLDKKKFKLLYNFSKKIGIQCFASIFAETELKEYHSVTNKIIKIPSHEAYNINLINKCIKKFKLVIISCGCLKKNELNKIIKKFGKKKNVILMHCVSSYPLLASNCNFAKFDYIKTKVKKVGYSGHFDGIDDAIYAVNKNAILIEKHFTTNKNLPGRDNKFALLPNDLKYIKNYFEKKKDFEKDRGNGLQKCEIDIFKNYRGRWQKKK